MKETVKTNYEVIFVLVNQGFTDNVMDAARSAGAKGGTIIATRGVGNEEAEKKYGVAITPNKELMLILVNTDIKTQVMNAIYKVAGIETKGMGIIWSSPADNVVGLKTEAKKEEKKESKK